MPGQTIKILGFIAMCAIYLPVQAANESWPETTDRLLPLGGDGIGFYDGYDIFLRSVTVKGDYPLSSIYIWRAFKPGVYIAIFQTHDESSYYIENALDTKPTPTVIKAPLSAVLAKELSDNFSRIIAKDTRYPADGKRPMGCTDATEYVFESDEMYGQADCPVSGSAAILEHFADKMEELGKLKTDEGRDQKFADLVQSLDVLDK